MAKRRDQGPDRPSSDYEVGYCRPPQEHSFKAGHKGNPWGCKGKPRPEQDFLEKRVRATLDGKKRWVTRNELVDQALYRAVIKDGNVSAAKELERRRQMRLAAKAEHRDADTLSPEEQDALLRAAERRLRQPGRRSDVSGPADGIDTISDEDR